MWAKIWVYVRDVAIQLVTRVLLYDLIVFAAVALSFIFTKGLTANAFSERLIWSGLAIGLVGGFLAFGQTAGGRDFGVPGQFVRTAHAQNLIDFNIESRQRIVTFFSIPFRLFMIGLFCFLAGMLIQVILPGL